MSVYKRIEQDHATHRDLLNKLQSEARKSTRAVHCWRGSCSPTTDQSEPFRAAKLE